MVFVAYPQKYYSIPALIQTWRNRDNMLAFGFINIQASIPPLPIQTFSEIEFSNWPPLFMALVWLSWYRHPINQLINSKDNLPSGEKILSKKGCSYSLRWGYQTYTHFSGDRQLYDPFEKVALTEGKTLRAKIKEHMTDYVKVHGGGNQMESKLYPHYWHDVRNANASYLNVQLMI